MTNDTTHAIRPGRLGPAISALLQAAVLVIGLPALLIRTVGWPLPHHVPQWAEIQRAYQLRYLPDRFVIGALACAGWICWTMILASLVHGAVAHVRATTYQRPASCSPGYTVSSDDGSPPQHSPSPCSLGPQEQQPSPHEQQSHKPHPSTRTPHHPSGRRHYRIRK